MASFTKPVFALAMLVTSLSSNASADLYRHIDLLALSIDQKAQLLSRETRLYRNTPEYRHLVNDARDMARWADHLHDVAHRRGSLAHLQSDVRKLDALFRHLAGVVDRVERRASQGQGRIYGDTTHVCWLLDSIGADIQILCESIRALRNPGNRVRRVPDVRTPSLDPSVYQTPISSPLGYGGYSDVYRVPVGNPVHDVHRSQYRPRGITIGGGSSRFTIRF